MFSFQNYPHVPSSNVQCHMTTIHTALAPTHSGKPKWKVSKSVRYDYPSSMQPVTPGMYLHGVLPASPEQSNSFYYGQPYVLRPQVPVPSPLTTPAPPRPYLTITQYNYQPVGYAPVQGPTGGSLVFGPPARDKRVQESHRFYQSSYDLDRSSSSRVLDQPKFSYSTSILADAKRSELKSDSCTSFDFSLHPDQVSNNVDDKSQDCYHCQHSLDLARIPEETNYTPRMWSEYELIDPMRIEDDELTKFIVEGCLKAEAIAVRNQHRPCFKNIKHLCTRTRTDILKPRTTVANIHSQGIPWATKDFIFAFVRLINCWYILKGYLDDHEGSLGKIEQTLTSDFKEVYQRWQNVNKEMVKHLINIFVNLDNGICVQNAEIFSSFNQAKKVLSSCSLPCEENNQNLETKSCPSRNIEYNDNKSSGSSDQHEPPQPSNIDSHIEEKMKYTDGKNVPGILRIKNICSKTSLVRNKEEDQDSEKDCKHKIYMKPGSYRVPKRHVNTPVQITPRAEFDKSSQDQVWKFAVKSFRPFIRNQMRDSESSTTSSEKDLTDRSNDDWIENYESLEEEESPKPKPKRRNKVSYKKRIDNRKGKSYQTDDDKFFLSE